DVNVLDELRSMQQAGKPDFLQQVIRLYLADTQRLLAAMRGALENADASTLHRGAHTLKSSSANVGALKLAELCKMLERDARSSAACSPSAPSAPASRSC